MKAIWEKVKAVIKERIPLHIYKMWIEPLEFKEGHGEVIALSCPNFFYKKRIEDHYALMIESEFRRLTGKLCKILIAISEEKENPKKKKSDHPEPDVQLSLPDIHAPQSGGRLLRKDFTFDRFVVGSNNDFAYSAALSLASQKDSTQNSLLLLSSTGMGKSHLSQAIGHHILSNHPFEKVYYITAEDFMNEMIHSFQSNSFEFFKEKYRNGCDVLLLEDVHFLNGKERTQVELSLALDYLFNAEKKIIFTSCCKPGDIPRLSEQLRSRLSSGLISNIEAPDFRTRIRILEKKVRENGYDIPKEVRDYLASELSENVRQLESGLIGVTAKASLMGSSIDLSLAESVVQNIVQQRKTIGADAIKKVVCKHYNISADEMLSKSRKKSLVWPRQIAIYLVRKYTDQPLQVIGKVFNRYHATILHSVAAVEKGLKEDASVRKQVEYLSQKLESGKF
ncbi:MAG: chromosomal replication initiator protein DnaA [Desulfobacteraceae bacterium IS3]|nr:MAG: chromosomal replication initiator protein DnaA [Desulfobacteraceae bacterium IS3]